MWIPVSYETGLRKYPETKTNVRVVYNFLSDDWLLRKKEAMENMIMINK